MRNNYKTTLFIGLALLISISSFAKPRTKAEMMSLAKKAINANRSKMHKAPRTGEVKELKRMEATSVMGFEDGGFAIVSTDDLLPEILGYSDTKFDVNTKNENLKWWMEAMEAAGKHYVAKGIKRTPVAPNPDLYEPSVPTMCTTKWDQAVPYNNYCPPGVYSGGGDGHDYGNDTERCVVGCVATAMAQVLAHNKYPTTGIGTHSVTVEQQGGNGTYTVNFEEAFYDYDNMLDQYIAGQYTEEQAKAVALLSYHCGVASDMEYALDGSGTYTNLAADGLRRNFGIETATFYDRNDSGLSTEDWMGLIFKELSEGRPLMYGGVSSSWFGSVGHEFVFDGYDENGLVSVNWGWSGDGDGYYDVDLLDVDSYEWKYYQDMVIGIEGGAPVDLQTKDLTLATPGTLANQIAEEDRLVTGELKITGDINSSDLKLLREMAGVDSEGNKTKGKMFSLDLSEARIVAGGNPYLVENGITHTTADDELPYKAFYKASNLRSLKLPKTIKNYGDGALALLNRMTELQMPEETEGQNYTVVENAIFNNDGTELIAMTPIARGEYTIPSTVTKVHAYAMAGCSKLTKVIVPETVTEMGREVMLNCSGLSQLRSESRTPPTVGASAFEGISSSSCKLFVPAGTKDLYSKAYGWKDLLNVKEYGTTIKPRNAARKYGEENPSFGYQLFGDFVSGTPEIYTDATPDSPVGRYPIHISAGTIDAPDVTFEEGYLIITGAPLKVTVEDATRKQYEEDPEFILHYEGFVNGEDESVFTTLPTVTSDATFDSPEGEYVLTISGGEAQNYKIKYIPGKLIIDGVAEVNDIKGIRISNDEPHNIYNVQGQLVRRNATSLSDLPAGIYIIEGKKVIVER